MIFNSININVDSVEFEYVTKGNLEVVSVSRPDGIGYSQWQDFWSRVDENSIRELKCRIKELERQVDENSEIDYDNGYDDGYRAAEKELESELEVLEDELSELKFRMEGLDK